MRITERIDHYMSYFPAVFFTFLFTIMSVTLWGSEESADMAFTIIEYIMLAIFILSPTMLLIHGLIVAYQKIKSLLTPNTITLQQKGDRTS